MDRATGQLIELAVNLGVPLVMLGLGYGIGHYREKAHYRSIKAREVRLLKLPVTNFKPSKKDLEGRVGTLVAGNVVIANDHFKRFAAGLRNIFGGRIRSYETLVDRARREAVLRMLREAEKMKAVMVVNLRVETSIIGANAQGGGGAVEVLAFGTALLAK